MTTRTGETFSVMLPLDEWGAAIDELNSARITYDSDPRETRETSEGTLYPLTVWIEDAPRVKQILGIPLTG